MCRKRRDRRRCILHEVQSHGRPIVDSRVDARKQPPECSEAPILHSADRTTSIGHPGTQCPAAISNKVGDLWLDHCNNRCRLRDRERMKFYGII